MSVGLSRLDLLDHQNAHECAEEYRIARDGLGSISMASWAAKWGDALVDSLRDPVSDEDDIARIAAVEKELNEEEAKTAALRAVISDAVDKLDAVCESDAASPRIVKDIGPIMQALEKATDE